MQLNSIAAVIAVGAFASGNAACTATTTSNALNTIVQQQLKRTSNR